MTGFATGAANPVDLLVTADGALLYLTRGSGGSVFRIDPTVQVTVTTSPPGLPLLIDGQSYATPLTGTAIVGSQHTVEAPALSSGPGGRTCSRAGRTVARASTRSCVPGSTATLTATYVPVTRP